MSNDNEKNTTNPRKEERLCQLVNRLWQWMGISDRIILLIGVLVFGFIGVTLISEVRIAQNLVYKNASEDNKRQFDSSLNLLKEYIGGIGTLATITGGVFLFLNFRIANKNAETANKNLQLTESRIITERFSKAVEQLGNDKIEIRLGGIYALERIAKDSERDHWTIMEVLTSFIQEKSPLITEELIRKKAQEISQTNESKSNDENWDNAEKELKKIGKDVQAALTVIGRRDVEKDKDQCLDLTSTNLQGANLLRANLERANLLRANLQEANLQYAKLERANLRDANLQEAILNGAKLQKADLWGANLEGTSLESANLQKAILKHIKLQKANLHEANLQGADLMHTNLQEVDLCMANLQKANLYEANLQEADLYETNLQEASLYEANLQEAYLLKANLQDAILQGVKNLNNTQIKSACNWNKAKFHGHWGDIAKINFILDEEKQAEKIKELEDDTASNPEKEPNCSLWNGFKNS